MSADVKTAVIKALRDTRALVGKGWTQGVNARDKNGDHTTLWPSGTMLSPVCWCLHGAVATATDVLRRNWPHHVTDGPQGTVNDQLNAQLRRMGWQPTKDECRLWFVQYNDAPGRKAEDILALIDNTIAHIEEHGLYEHTDTV